MSRYPATWLYVAIGEDGVLKVGSSSNPQNRMKLLRAEQRQRFSLCRTWHRPQADGRMIEFIAHALLRKYCCFGREFYRAPLEVLYDAVELAVRKAEAGDVSDLAKHSALARGPLAAAREAKEQRLWDEVRRLAEEAAANGLIEPFLEEWNRHVRG